MFQVRSEIGHGVDYEAALSRGFAEIILGHGGNFILPRWATAIKLQVADATVVVDTPGTTPTNLEKPKGHNHTFFWSHGNQSSLKTTMTN